MIENIVDAVEAYVRGIDEADSILKKSEVLCNKSNGLRLNTTDALIDFITSRGYIPSKNKDNSIRVLLSDGERIATFAVTTDGRHPCLDYFELNRVYTAKDFEENEDTIPPPGGYETLMGAEESMECDTDGDYSPRAEFCNWYNALQMDKCLCFEPATLASKKRQLSAFDAMEWLLENREQVGKLLKGTEEEYNGK